ncbi:prenyltransferase/squalene oxidase repeat-containing protein [Actinocorallia longicatena]|uniref:Squalene-hopene/tetraprenyl-beta-curcumene cyclase n=1 Tax=Actinocorallia longicatena TaxID=111803 RepID=A0ABP6QHR1_9ACTN
MSEMAVLARSGVRDARALLVDHLLERVSGDGAVRDRCRSRVLESALALVAVTETGLFPEHRQRLLSYLRGHPAPPDGFDGMLAAAALGAAPDPERALAWLDGFDHFTAPRKRLMFTGVLAVLGAVPFPAVPPIPFRGQASWVELTLCALDLLHHGDRPGSLAFLTDRLEHGSLQPVWEGHVLAHLLAVIALNREVPGHRLAAEGLAAVLATQNDDGGVPFVAGMEVFCTVTAGLALHAARTVPLDRTFAMGDYLAGRQRPGGGWSYAEGVAQADVDDTSYCLQFLRALSPERYAAEIAAAGNYLTEIAGPDGGFPTFLRGHDSELAMTAGALGALDPVEHSGTFRAATAHLLAAQRPDGTFECGWSLAETNAVFRTLAALARIPCPGPAVTRAITTAAGRLMSTQNLDGGWGQRPGDPSDPISTAYALSCTRRWPASPTHRAGLGYLLARQNPDGGYTSRPDQAGPRPIPWDVPVLASIGVLQALAP